MRNLRLALLPALLMLAACGRDEPVAVPALPKDLATFTVAAGGALPGRGWDGVVEAVRRADLAAQTGGRVTQVLVDVNDRVRQGDVLLRITAQEQEAAANAARAQLRARMNRRGVVMIDLRVFHSLSFYELALTWYMTTLNYKTYLIFYPNYFAYLFLKMCNQSLQMLLRRNVLLYLLKKKKKFVRQIRF